jgi:hypothetical protein
VNVELDLVGGGPCTLDEFAERHGLVMEIHERAGVYGDGRYYAHFKSVEEMRDGMLCGTYGNGATPEQAVAAYARKIRGKCLAVKAGSKDRRNIQVPNEFKADEVRSR